MTPGTGGPADWVIGIQMTGHTAHYVKTSSTKLHKARGEPTEPWPQATCSFPKSGFEVSEISEQTVKHSNRQTDIGLLITILCIPLGDRVKMQCFTPVTALNRERLKVWGQTNYETSNEAGKVTLGSPNLRSSLVTRFSRLQCRLSSQFVSKSSHDYKFKWLPDLGKD